MKQDLHPLWKSTDEPSHEDEATQAPSEPLLRNTEVHRVPIQRKHPLQAVVMSLSLGISLLLFLAFVFVQGVSFLTANLTQDADQTTSDMQQEEAYLTDIPLPTLEPDTNASEIPQPIPPEPAVVPTVMPEVIAPPSQPEVISLGEEPKAAPQFLSWPSILKVNRFVVGSALVPDLTRVVQISIDAIGKKTQAHNAANVPDTTKKNDVLPVHNAPATGPGLWVVVLVSSGVLTMFGVQGVRKAKGKR